MASKRDDSNNSGDKGDGGKTYIDVSHGSPQEPLGQVKVTGSGNLQAEGTTISGSAKLREEDDQASASGSVKDNNDTTVNVGTAGLYVKGNPVHVSTTSTSESQVSKNESSSDKDLSDDIPTPVNAVHSSLNDSASAIDSIGFAPYVKALAKLICHEDTQVPLAVGIFGQWGAGKTSFMKQLKDEIDEKVNKKTDDKKWYEFYKDTKNYNQVWFNAWKYDNQSDLWAALLQAITSQIEENTNYFSAVIRRFKRLSSWKFYIQSFSILLVLGFIVWLTGGNEVLPKYDDLVGKATPDTAPGLAIYLMLVVFPPGLAILIFHWVGVLKPIYELIRKIKNPLGIDVNELMHGKSLPDKIKGISAFDDELKTRLGDYLGKKGRLIVYVDDLDRCTPSNAVEIIEAINLFLDSDRCIFIVGMDHKLISASIELKYKELSERYSKDTGGCSYGEFFLKKIIQIPISVPSLTLDEVNGYVEGFIHPKEKKIKEPEIKKKTDKNQQPQKIVAVFDVSMSHDVKSTFFTLLPYIDPNPRSIKRFYNMLNFLHMFYVSNRSLFEDINDIALTMWFFLTYHFPDEVVFLRNRYDLDWDDVTKGCEGRCDLIKDFFLDYTEDVKKADVMNKLDGSIGVYSNITRIFES